MPVFKANLYAQKSHNAYFSTYICICSLFSSEQWKCCTKRTQLFLFPFLIHAPSSNATCLLLALLEILCVPYIQGHGASQMLDMNGGDREWRNNLSISSAHTYSSLPHWISLTKHLAKDKILKGLQDSNSRALNQAQGPSEHRVWADCTGCWPMKLALLSTQFHLRQQSKVKRSNRNSLLFDSGGETNYPSSCRSPNQEYNLIIQKEG